MLTAEQKAHWETFGFLMLRQLFAPEEVEELRQAIIEVMNQTGGEDALTSDSGYGVGAIAERHPVLTDWLVDDRIYETMETLLGPDFFLMHTAGAVFRGDTPGTAVCRLTNLSRGSRLHMERSRCTSTV